MAKKKDNHGRQQGATNHPPGLHGDKTLSQLAENTNTSNQERDRTGPEYDPEEIRTHARDEGKSRLFEDRQQHDEAEEASEQIRLSRDRQRHKHD